MNLTACLSLSAILFSFGIFGLMTRRKIIAMLLAIELMLNAALINCVAFAYYAPAGADTDVGSILPIFIVAITSAEMAVALAVIVAMYRKRKVIDIERLEDLHD